MFADAAGPTVGVMTTHTSSHASSTVPTPSAAPPGVAAPSPLQRAGGFASLVEGLTYVAGFGVMAAYLGPRGFVDAQQDPSAALSFLLANQGVMYAWYLLIYLVAGAALVVLVLGAHERIRHRGGLAQVTTAFGLIWSGLVLAAGMVSLVGQRAAIELAPVAREDAGSLWASARLVQEGLGGGIELVGAVWVLLLSVAAGAARALPRGLCVLGAVIGLAGVVTVVPAVADGAAAVFGLGFIVWYLWAGLVLRRA